MANVTRLSDTERDSHHDRSAHLVRVLRFAPGFEDRRSIILDSMFGDAERSGVLLRELSRRHVLHLGDLAGMTIAQVFEGCALSFQERREFLSVIADFGLLPSPFSRQHLLVPPRRTFSRPRKVARPGLRVVR
jgi:hypothetical protein